MSAPVITKEIVEEYVKAAESDSELGTIFKECWAETMEISEADEIDAQVLLKRLWRLSDDYPHLPEDEPAALVQETLSALRDDSNSYGAVAPRRHGSTISVCIMEEFYKAFCQNDKRYAVEVAQASSNVKLLIGAVAGYAASSLHISVTIISALAAAMLWLICKVGLNAFCAHVAKCRPDLSEPSGPSKQ